MKRPIKSSWVYLIGYADATHDEPLKIGLARDPYSRLASLQTGSPRRLALYDKIPGDRVTERAFHEAMKDRRVALEWYAGAEELEHAFDMLRERMLDRAEEVMGLDWTPDDPRGGMITIYEGLTTPPDLVAAEVERSFAYYAYARQTDDWNLDLPGAPKHLADFPTEVTPQ